MRTFHLFVDFKAACDATRRAKLLESFIEFKIPPTLIRLIKLTLKHVRRVVQIHNNLPEKPDTSTGLRQGGAFLVYFSIWHWRRQLQTAARSADELKQLPEAAQVTGLTVNMQKTKHTEVTKIATNTTTLITDDSKMRRRRNLNI
jgi:hypothetical protein